MGAAGCQNEAGAVVPCAHGGVVPFGVPVAAAPAAAEEPAVEEARKKREAEAEAEADPEAEADAWYFYRTHGYWPVGYGHLAYSYAPYAYAGQRLLRAWPPLRLLRQEEEGGDR